MIDEEKQEMANEVQLASIIRKVLTERIDIQYIPDLAFPVAKELLKHYVVLSKEEYKKDFCSQFNKGYEQARKETAREFVVNFENDIDKLDTIIYEETLENYVSVNAVLKFVDELAKQFDVEVEE